MTSKKHFFMSKADREAKYEQASNRFVEILKFLHNKYPDFDDAYIIAIASAIYAEENSK